MIKRNSTAANALWIIACRIVQALLGLAVSMLSARYLGPSNYGLISYAASVVAFVLPIMQLGFRSTLVQEIVNDPEKEGEIMGTALFFNALSSFACIIGVISFVYIANPGEINTVVVCALYCVSLLFQALEMIQYWFQAKLISRYMAVVSLIAYVAVSAYKIFLLIAQKSVYWFAISQTIDYLIISVSLMVLYRKLGVQKLSVSLRRGIEMLKKSRYFIVSSLMVTVFAQTDKIMLKSMLDESAVGIYTAAITCAGMTSFVFSAIIDSFRPSVFENKKSSEETYEKNLIGCYSVIIYLSLIQSVVLTLLAPIAIFVLYGPDYSASSDVLRLVVWYTTFSYLGPVRNIWILAENKQKYLWIINLSGAVVNVILNLIMIPIMGVMGAAIASLVTQVFTNVIIGYIIKPIRYNNRLMFKSLNPKIMLGYSLTVLKRLKKR